MQTLGKIAATLGVVGVIALGGAAPAAADWYYGHRHHGYHGYYNYYGGGGSPCRRGWTVQGGVCKPYIYGPWDIYGGTHQDWGYR
jgi:hypothetical protein